MMIKYLVNDCNIQNILHSVLDCHLQVCVLYCYNDILFIFRSIFIFESNILSNLISTIYPINNFVIS